MMTNLTKLRQQHDEYIDRMRASGVTILKFTVPCCGATEESRAGPATGQWDTLATCSHCGDPYMKISKHDAITALEVAR